MKRSLGVVVFVSLAAIIPTSVMRAQQQGSAAEPFRQAIRANDLAALRALVAERGADAKEAGGLTPLTVAAAIGTPEAVDVLLQAGADVKAVGNNGITALHLAWNDAGVARRLIERGADVNAKTQQGSTPLLIAASAVGTLDVVKLLLDRGAEVDAADGRGVTPLIAAASVGNGAVARLLLERGADPSAYAPGIGVKTATPLIGAANSGDVELTRLLLARKVPLDVKSSDRDANVKNGPVVYGEVTALHMATAAPSAAIVRLLLEAGAQVDVTDVRGTTPLSWAIATDRPDREIIKLLLDRGANPALASKLNETPRDWAQKFQDPAVLGALRLQPAPRSAVALQPAHARQSAREAVERALPLLRSSSQGVMTSGGCVACHAQPMSVLASTYAAKRGWRAETPAPDLAQIKMVLGAGPTGMLQNRDGGDLGYGQLYIALALSTAQEAPTFGTDGLVSYLLAKQREEGYWHGITTRPPQQDGVINKTALAIHALTAYPIPARQAQIQASVRRAAAWLGAQVPLSTEERTMQLRGLAWADADPAKRATLTRELIAQQRSDGGWAQTPYLLSDAYATGQALVTLRELGVPSSNDAIRRGVAFLTSTQAADGSWYVRSRANKIQPYFESGFPHGHDQWASQAGTAWAVMGLSVAAEEESARPATVAAR